MTEEMLFKFEEKIRLDWRYEQVSGCLKVNQGIAISHERNNQPIIKRAKIKEFT